MEENKKEKPHQPHDALFTGVFQEKEAVIDLALRAFPKELLDLIDLDKLKQDTNNYVSSELAKTFSDVVWRTSQKGGNSKVAIALLFEHKSYQPKDIFVQLIHYMSSIWLRDVAARKPLTIIIPIVFYHGKTKWKKKLFFESFKNLSLVFKKFIPEFEYILFEVFQTPDRTIIEMSNEHLLGALMLQFKKAGDADFIRKYQKNLFKYFDKHPEKRELLRIFVSYLFSQAPMENEEFIDLINNSLSSEIKSETMTAYQSTLNKGKAEGKAEGKVEERKKVITRMLVRGLFTVPGIADAMEESVSFVVEIRDALLQEGNKLPALVRDFKIQ